MSKRLETMEQMIAKGATDPFVFYGRAMELRSLGRLGEALSAFEDIRARFPTYLPAYLMAGQVATELARTEEARDWLLAGHKMALDAGDQHTASELSAALEALG
jgi:tetratricopeptide (TPR) repeat protein